MGREFNDDPFGPWDFAKSCEFVNLKKISKNKNK